MNSLEAIRFSNTNGNCSLEIINQLLLPFETNYISISNTADAHAAIVQMNVRGAPAIAIIAALSLAVEISKLTFTNNTQVYDFINLKLEYLKTSRPTAVNLFEAAARLDAITKHALLDNKNPKDIVQLYMEKAELMLEKDIQDNKNIGRHGADFILQLKPDCDVSILTHCNTGSLATAGWGTALGVIRELSSRSKLNHAFCTETRPYNQGARLTAYELVYEKIPSTLICDDMVSALLKTGKISAIVVGADRVAANGDTANKIGTFQMAISAKYHNVPFLVAAPITSIDLNTKTGESIVIEERSELEVVQIRGLNIQDGKTMDTVKTSAPGINVWNPAFDVTPASLITAIVTEKGVITQTKDGKYDLNEFLKI